ncbi:MAG: CRISPR-associated endonuclease Cas3'' [Thermoprotei archaeon]|nr:MAG: CRISPR-associated endonuclease Cas3'' [Thermoprotei archaeon]
MRSYPKIPYAYTKHPLAEHLRNCMDIALKVSENWSLPEVICHRLRIAFKRSGVDIEVSEDIITYIIKCSSLLHDVGKAATIYQKQFNDDGSLRGRNEPSFRYHEVPSAVLTFRYLSKMNVEYELTMLASLAVLMHMSTIRNPLDRDMDRSLKNIRMFRHGWIISTYKDALSKLLDMDIKLNVTLSEALDFIERARSYASAKNRRHAKLYTLILLPIIVGDNVDSFNHRRKTGGKISSSRLKFMKEIFYLYSLSGGDVL